MTLVVKQKESKDQMLGKVIGGRYRVTHVIGQGGFGAVYKCTHTATGDTLAIKVLRTDVADNLDVVARFRMEAKATSRLKHPNTVRVFDFGQMDDGNLFLAMEFLDGRTLTDLMRKEGPLEPERLVHVGLQVLKSLSEAHSKGLVHRDLKPDNIFVQNIHGEPDFVRVLDFGIAKSLTADKQDITSTGAVIGTPKYMSPEQARGQTVDQRTDLYSLGIMLFEGVSGTPPFMAETPLAMILRRVTEDPPRVHDNIALPTPIGLCDAILKSLARNPDDRYETADEMAAALTAAMKSPLHLPTGQTVGGGSGEAGSGTAAYGDIGGGDDTFAMEAGAGDSDSHVVVTSAPGKLDDATAFASADELAAAAESMAADASDTVIEAEPATAEVTLPKPAPAPPSTQPPSDIRAAPISVAPPARKSNVGLIAVVLVGIATLAGIALVTLGGDKPKPPPPSIAAPVPVPPPAAVKPAPVKPAAPAVAKVKVSRQPTTAVVTIDGVTVLGDTHELKPGMHEVKASSEGYEPLTMKIQATPGPMALPIQLKKLAAKPVAPVEPTTKPKPTRRPRRRPVANGGKPAAKPIVKPRHKPKPKPKPKPKDESLLID
ncbi:MAG: serine/threonine protein kinase [Myxococcales bacterium]|nr:serine/threonine protein kinase [Myxococcales bacterium]